MTLIYAGIGSRQTPPEMLNIMTALAEQMAVRGHTLRSGGAMGADTAFEQGCDKGNGLKEIYLPWRYFNANRSAFHRASSDAFTMAKEFHPAWDKCSDGARQMHARNCHQVLGWSLDKPADLIICWTPGAQASGGTGQAIRIARANNIPVFDLADPANFDKLDNFEGI